MSFPPPPTSQPSRISRSPMAAASAGPTSTAPATSATTPRTILRWYATCISRDCLPVSLDLTFVRESTLPTYKNQSQPTAATGGQIPSFNLFNNLDETSQIRPGEHGCSRHIRPSPRVSTLVLDPTTLTTSPSTPGPATGTRVAYEAKVNRAVFTYGELKLGSVGPAYGNSSFLCR